MDPLALTAALAMDPADLTGGSSQQFVERGGRLKELPCGGVTEVQDLAGTTPGPVVTDTVVIGLHHWF